MFSKNSVAWQTARWFKTTFTCLFTTPFKSDAIGLANRLYNQLVRKRNKKKKLNSLCLLKKWISQFQFCSISGVNYVLLFMKRVLLLYLNIIYFPMIFYKDLDQKIKKKNDHRILRQ